MESSRLKIHTPCALESRIEEFIPPQRRHVQEHRNNLTTLAHITLKRHECRAPLARFMGCLHLKIHTLCDHESLPARAALLRSLNVKAARHHRPTDIVTRFLESGNLQGLIANQDTKHSMVGCVTPCASLGS